MSNVTLSPKIPYFQPTKVDPELQRWTDKVYSGINARTPTCSFFSASSPNSNVTAGRGELGVNLLSTASVFWIKQVGSGNTGWVALA